MSPPAVNLLIQDRHVVIYNYILFVEKDYIMELRLIN